jgi:hypothetical protein
MPLKLPIDGPRAVLLARAARAAYFDDPAAICGMLEMSHARGALATVARDESECYVFDTLEETIAAFRGSVTLGDWIYNSNVRLAAWSGPGRIHQGFAHALDAVWPDVERKFMAAASAGRKIWLTGHSLGGAMAAVAAARLEAQFGIPIEGVVTFGAPKVGDESFAAHFDRTFAGKNCFLLNQGDPVPWLPVFPSEFVACGDGYMFDGKGRLRRRPGMFEATILFLAEILSKPPEEMLSVPAHAKEEYLRLVERCFSPVRPHDHTP